MRYCKKCVLPDTRPGLTINEFGICSVCEGYDDKKLTINWPKRKKKLEELISQAKKRAPGYECVIPVSGGKDSTWQVIKCKEFGLRILAVSWKTPARTALGQKNLDNLIRLGVDQIDYTINPDVERRFMYRALVKTGTVGIPMHMAIYSIPLKIAVAFNIPLVVWGESPHMEYGGSKEDRDYDRLDLGWSKHHDILKGTLASDWVDKELSREDLCPYFLPSEKEFKKKRIISIFLGYYLPWDPLESLRVAQKHGFQVRNEGPKVGYYNYADIDCDFISVHHYFKWLKFGFTRLFDNLSIEIRNGRMSREEAIKIIEEKGPQVPYEDIYKLCKFLGISFKHFHEIEEKFRNRKIWTFEKKKWKIKDFITTKWEW